MIEIKNAKIAGTMLGYEDHGVLTYMIILDYDRGGQGFGGYALDEYNQTRKCRLGTAYGTAAIGQLLRTVGVESWEKLPGTPVRVQAEHIKVHSIGHYLKDDWLDLAKLAAEYASS